MGEKETRFDGKRVPDNWKPNPMPPPLRTTKTDADYDKKIQDIIRVRHNI